MIHIETKIHKPIAEVWEFWTNPKHIVNWNFANEDWHCPKAENDLQKGGKFSSTMASKDGKMSFDFGGIYTKIINHKLIAYSLEDGRKVEVKFTEDVTETVVENIFEPEKTNPKAMQKAGWQAVLNNFKNYVEKQ